MRIAICEDLKKDSDRLYAILSDYLSAHNLSADIFVFPSGEALLEDFFHGKYQMLFLDIYMERDGLTGVQVAERVREVDEDVAIIFTTTSYEHGPESYDVSAAYYIVKPMEKEKLEKAMDKCRIQLDRYAKTIEIVENRQALTIRLRDICYAEVIGHSSLLYMCSNNITTRVPFGELAEKLNMLPFITCHRSYIVNLVHVADLQGRDFIMKNGDKVPISKTYQEQAQKAFKEYFWGD